MKYLIQLVRWAYVKLGLCEKEFHPELVCGPPIGFEDWLKNQPLAVKTAVKACPPGPYFKGEETGIITGYRQDQEDGKVYVTFSVPSMTHEEVHINQLTAMDE